MSSTINCQIHTPPLRVLVLQDPIQVLNEDGILYRTSHCKGRSGRNISHQSNRVLAAVPSCLFMIILKPDRYLFAVHTNNPTWLGPSKFSSPTWLAPSKFSSRKKGRRNLLSEDIRTGCHPRTLHLRIGDVTGKNAKDPSQHRSKFLRMIMNASENCNLTLAKLQTRKESKSRWIGIS